MCFKRQKIKFQLKKMGQNFHICLWSRSRGLIPTPYGQPDRKISVSFFDDFPLDTLCQTLRVFDSLGLTCFLSTCCRASCRGEFRLDQGTSFCELGCVGWPTGGTCEHLVV